MNTPWFRLVVGATLLVLAGLVAYNVGRQVYVAYTLQQQVSLLRQRNAQIADQNSRYTRELALASQPEGVEEQARKLGYVKPGDQVYIVSQPSPSPSPPPRPVVVKLDMGSAAQASLWSQFWRWLTNHWH